jgi:aspartate/methionine/tyrosine aminotransferase
MEAPLFPYMAFARNEAHGVRFPLFQSGMPTADPSLLACGPEQLEYAGKSALPSLQEGLAERFGVPPERVLVALGASGAMHLVAARWFRPGTLVLSEVPSYEPLRTLPQLFGAKAALVERRLEEGWRIDPSQVRRALAGVKGPAHVFLTNPNNPTGVLQGREEIAAIAREVEPTGGILISNEVYMEYVPRERRVHGFALAPNALSLGSLTKAYGLGSLRIGWIVLGEGLAEQRAALEDVTYMAWVDPPTPSLVLGRKALGQLAALRAPLERCEREVRPAVSKWLSTTEGVRAVLPEFGIIAFARLQGIDDTRALARRLASEFDVGVVPGEFFGSPGCVRIGFGGSREQVVGGLERLASGLAACR